MEVNGVWVGYGLGDCTPYVQKMKQYLVKMFHTYAGPLQASLTEGGTAAQTYDQTMVDVVTEMQGRYGANAAVNPALVINGIMSYSWQIRCGFIPPPPVTILTWQGTGVDMWDQMSPQPYGAAMYAKGLLGDLVFVQPIGNYPASIANPSMGASVNMGVAEGKRQLQQVHPTGKVILFGYSQGAICSSHLWRDEILSETGQCHNRLNDVILHLTFGNPCRTPGVANGNDYAGWGMPGKKDGAVTGGISGPDCLRPEQTPHFQYDFVWLGSDGGGTELYTNAPVGANPWTAEATAGVVGTSIYNVVQTDGFMDIVKIAKDLGHPIGMVEEIYNGIAFVAKGPNADHFDYNWAPAIDLIVSYVRSYASAFTTSGGARSS